MRRTVVRRSAVAALALLATACGGSSDGGDKGKDGKPAQAAPGKALSAAELEKAALTQADVKTGKIVTKVPAQDDIAQDKVSADNPACKPLAYLQVGSYVGKPAATVKRSWTGDAKKPAAGASSEEKMLAITDRPKTVETLASYDNGGAEQAVKDLQAAAKKCAGGFSFTVGSDKTKIVKVVTTAAPQGADEAVALTWFIDAEGQGTAPMKGVVVRKGATLAYFPVLNIAAAATGKDFDFPTEIVDAQLAKLG
ncbi:hypothetical protein [Streptomyces griseochromogenes]|uniref:hypothetical protein n=1 Tax=Streptomyces griseochromogenes TaxID=68214 RepID=UPI0037A3BCC6